MPLASLLPRVLLIVSLVFNGSGYAFASGHTDAATHGDPGEESAQQARSPCHEEGGVAAPDRAATDHDTALAAAPRHPPGDMHAADHAESGCCEAAPCRCACMHACAVAVLMPLDGQVPVVGGTAARPLVSAHPSPALPHLIRPPIG